MADKAVAATPVARPIDKILAEVKSGIIQEYNANHRWWEDKAAKAAMKSLLDGIILWISTDRNSFSSYDREYGIKTLQKLQAELQKL